MLCFLLLALSSIHPILAAPKTDSTGFVARVLPILTKAGCNSGACHGAAVGQGGFKLSLLGYDPEQDFETITRELTGRRLDLAEPEQSLLIRKGSRQLDHEGGLRLKRDSGEYRAVVQWIRDGAGYGPRGLQVTRIEVAPADILLLSPGESRNLRVTAHWSDGRVEDATSLALYSSNDDGLAEVDAAGKVHITNRGVTAIMIRYLGQVTALRVGAPFQAAEVSGFKFPPQNFIDEKVAAELKRLRLPPASLCSDVEFLRRVNLDVAGRLPDPEQVRAFIAPNASGQKRAEVIEQLLASPEFVDFWTVKLGDLLLINSGKMGKEGARAYRDWLHEQLARNTPVDRMVRALLTATGDASASGPPNFYRVAADPRDIAEFVSQSFLGVRVACARCHNHPFDRWTMSDYHHFAAYFARTGFEGQQVVQRAQGEVQHPKTGRDMQPAPLGSPVIPSAMTGDRRKGLADWLAARDNPMLARALVNRVWKELLGRGLIEPVDDVRATNPASNPALLEALASDFAKHDYDLRHLVRTIVNSRTYQLSAATNETNRRDDRFFSHAYLKPLRAQVLADAVAQSTGMWTHYGGYPAGTTAMQLVDAQTPSYALDAFGRCPRTASCENPAQFGGGLSQSLHLINGTAINDRLDFAVTKRLPDVSRPAREAIEQAYLLTVSRFPTVAETEHWTKLLATTSSRNEALEDLFWALLNSREFAFNH